MSCKTRLNSNSKHNENRNLKCNTKCNQNRIMNDNEKRNKKRNENRTCKRSFSSSPGVRVKIFIEMTQNVGSSIITAASNERTKKVLSHSVFMFRQECRSFLRPSRPAVNVIKLFLFVYIEFACRCNLSLL
jgi:hypothetical protein